MEVGAYVRRAAAAWLLLLLEAATCSRHAGGRARPGGGSVERAGLVLRVPTYALRVPPKVTVRRNSNLDLGTAGTAAVGCASRNVSESIAQMRKRVGCAPRDAIVDLSGQAGQAIIPGAMVLKRCGGLCSGRRRCVSAAQQPVRFYVRSVDEDVGRLVCSSVQVYEDTECRCACPARRDPCTSPAQRYDKKLCKYVCTNQDAFEECTKRDKADFKWDPKTCSCACRNHKTCTTGTEWQPDKCRCRKLIAANR